MGDSSSVSSIDSSSRGVSVEGDWGVLIKGQHPIIATDERMKVRKFFSRDEAVEWAYENLNENWEVIWLGESKKFLRGVV